VSFALYIAMMCGAFTAIIDQLTLKEDEHTQYNLVALLGTFVIMVIAWMLFKKPLQAVCDCCRDDSSQDVKRIMNQLQNASTNSANNLDLEGKMSYNTAVSSLTQEYGGDEGFSRGTRTSGKFGDDMEMAGLRMDTFQPNGYQNHSSFRE